MKDDEFIPKAARWLATVAPTPRAMVRFSSGSGMRCRSAKNSGSRALSRELGQRIAAAHPDVLIVVSPDHWSNFFLDNVPAVCIGVGETNEGPPEPWMKAFPHRKIPGHPALALHIVSEVMKQGFEPSVSHRLKLDQGFAFRSGAWASSACRASCPCS